MLRKDVDIMVSAIKRVLDIIGVHSNILNIRTNRYTKQTSITFELLEENKITNDARTMDILSNLDLLNIIVAYSDNKYGKFSGVTMSEDITTYNTILALDDDSLKLLIEIN